MDPNKSTHLSNEFYEAKASNSVLLKKSKTKYLAFSIAVLCLVVLLLIIALIISESSTMEEGQIIFPVTDSPMGVYSKAAVACDYGGCSDVGKEMLRRGGSAVDAAIATLTCNGIYTMHAVGFGGGGYILYYDSKTQLVSALNAFSTAPKNSSSRTGPFDFPDLRDGKYSVGVPGHLAGLYEIHKRYGRLTWKELVQPSIELCENGFEVGPVLANAIEDLVNEANVERYPEMTTLLEYLTKNNGTEFVGLNDTLTCKQFAKTLRIVAEEGPMSFYNGSLAELLLEDFRELGIPIDSEDLLNYRVNTSFKPLSMKLKNGWTMYTTRPETGGAASAFVLNVLSGYRFDSKSKHDTLTYHRFVEALKFAFGQFSHFGDETFMDASALDDLTIRVANMLDPSHGEYVRTLINDQHVRPINEYGYYGNPPLGMPDVSDHSTTHVNVLDEEGNVFTMTTTNNRLFGSYVMGPRTGILFNNVMVLFFPNVTIGSMPSPVSPANFIEPGKRPASPISPSLFIDHNEPDPSLQVRMAVGASGTNRILASVPYVVMRILWFGETPKEATDAGRLLHSVYPDRLDHEVDFPVEVLDYLYERGDLIQKPLGLEHSACQVIYRLPNNTILAMSDYRKALSYTAGF